MEKLKNQYDRGKISQEQYEKKLADLTAKQDLANQVVDGGSTSVQDYKAQMEELARTKYETSSKEFQEERAEIVANIKAIRAYKNELLKTQLTELEGLKQRQEIEREQPQVFGGSIATLTDSSVFNLEAGIRQTRKEIEDANTDLAEFDAKVLEIRKNIEESEKPVEDYSASVEGVGGGASKAKDGLEDLEDAIDSIEDSTEQMVKKNEEYVDTTNDLNEANHKFYKQIKDDLRDVGDQIEDVNQKYQDTVDEIEKRTNSQILGNTESFARRQAEEEARALESIAELQKDLAELEAETLEDDKDRQRNRERQLEVEQKIAQEREKLLRIQENLQALENDTLVEAERERAGLTDEERALFDFQDTQEQLRQNAELEKQKAEQARNAELERLEQRKRILELFQDQELNSSKQLYALLENERVQAMDTENLRLLERLAMERIELIELNEKKKDLAEELYDYTTTLENQFYNTVSGNVDRLTAKYQELINKIRQAIQEQQVINSLRAESRASGGPVTAGKPYLVGDNPDGSANPTTELFIPGQSGSIVSAQRVQEALRQAGALPGGNVDNSKHFVNEGPINFNNSFDFELRLERRRFRS